MSMQYIVHISHKMAFLLVRIKLSHQVDDKIVQTCFKTCLHTGEAINM
jgi:hypothetical protein